MTTQLARNRMSLPPPLTSVLSDAGRVVGWVSDDTIGFGGFADEAEAMAAAWMAHRTLARRRARHEGSRPVPIDVEPLALARDGRHEAILASGRSIATLIRPGDDSRSGPDAFAFEIRVPAPRDAARMHAEASLVYRTLRRAGIRWALWRAEDRGDARPHASRAAGAAGGDVRERRARVGGRAPETGSPQLSTGARTVRRRVAGATAALAVVAVALLLPRLTATHVVAVLGGLAALVAVMALAAIVRLVVTDVRTDVRRALRRRARHQRRRALRDGLITNGGLS